MIFYDFFDTVTVIVTIIVIGIMLCDIYNHHM